MDKLSILQRVIKQKLAKIRNWRLLVRSQRLIVLNAHSNLNENYRFGLVQRFYFNSYMRMIEETLDKFTSFESRPLMKNYKDSINAVGGLISDSEQIMFSVGLPELSNMLISVETINFTSRNEKFYRMIRQLFFLDKYVRVISASIENKSIMNPLFIDLHTIGQTPFDHYATCFLLIPFKKQQVIQIKLHFRKDNLYSFKKEGYFGNKLEDIRSSCSTLGISQQIVSTFVEHILSPKDFVIKSISQIRSMLFDFNHKMKTYKEMNQEKLIKLFMNRKLVEKANMITTLLLMTEVDESYIHLAWLLFDMYNSNDSELAKCNPNDPDLWDILTWKAQKLLRIAKTKVYEQKKNAMEDVNPSLSYEQKIQLLKVNKDVKQKAYTKLKEASGRQNDSSAKAINWLDGLLKIPFGIYKKEKFIRNFEEIKSRASFLLTEGEEPYFQTIQSNIKKYEELLRFFTINKENELKLNTETIKTFLKNNNLKQLRELWDKITNNEKLTKKSLKKSLFIQKIITHITPENISKLCNVPKAFNKPAELIELHSLKDGWYKMKQYQHNHMRNIRGSLDKAIHAHENAKDQIERIVAQWMTGKSSGYVLGFEGPPGVGKTTMAKYGLANALKDEDGEPRPFKFIAIGGGCNGSVLEGHSYTYMGSQWGSIANALMESGCMNPIIFFDELDKVSNTAHGREIIGILTHLTDSTQNSAFHDKYFNGIDLDLSKALIIFSYNDPSSIDPILLDRIHRIKFKEMTLEDKMVVIRKYLIPSICKEVGLDSELIIWEDELIEFIIDNYTLEPGVRKIKQIMYDVYRDINVNILRDCITEFPHTITKDYIVNNILRKYIRVYPLEIKGENKIGVINGMYATRSGFGGILQIESKFICETTPFKLLLTGSLKDVMLESMQIARNVALELLPSKKRSELTKKIMKKDNMMRGIHIHCPEGAVPKDGPSAGQAITLCLYSMFMNKPIPDNFSFTGEIRLSGEVMRVGGISSKVMGALRAGVRNIILPEENRRDYEMFREEVKNAPDHNIYFVSNIHQSMKILWG